MKQNLVQSYYAHDSSCVIKHSDLLRYYNDDKVDKILRYQENLKSGSCQSRRPMVTICTRLMGPHSVVTCQSPLHGEFQAPTAHQNSPAPSKLPPVGRHRYIVTLLLRSTFSQLVEHNLILSEPQLTALQRRSPNNSKNFSPFLSAFPLKIPEEGIVHNNSGAQPRKRGQPFYLPTEAPGDVQMNMLETVQAQRRFYDVYVHICVFHA